MSGTTRIFNGTVNVTENLKTPPTVDATHGNIEIGSTKIHDFSTDPTTKNFFAGPNSGNYTLTGLSNIGIGNNVGTKLAEATSNTLLNGGLNLTTGSRNLVAGGTSPGSNYSSNESDNICLSNAGVTGDQKTIRIGDTHTGCYIAGITGVPVTGSPVFVGTDGHLGVGSSAGISLAPIGTNPNVNAATLNGSTLNLEPASASFGGIVTTGAQTFAGTKTFAITNVGVNSTTGSDLIFPIAVKNKKINLYPIGADDNENQYYGFGVNSNILRYQVYNTSADHVFYASTSTTTSNELFRVKGAGGITLPTTGGTASVLNYYQEYAVSTFIDGGWNSPSNKVAVNLRATRIGRNVTMYIGVDGGTGAFATQYTQPSFLTLDITLATIWRPTATVIIPIAGRYGTSTYAPALFQITNAGAVSFFPSPGDSTWSYNNAIIGVYNMCVSYTL